MTEEQPKEGRITRIRKKLAGTIYPQPERVRRVWDDFHYEAGLIPVLNETTTEVRRQEVKGVLQSIKSKLNSGDSADKKEAVNETYALFFGSGNPWYRGLNDRELAKKVSKFGKLYNRNGDLPGWLGDLVMCCMQLISLSWQALDVTPTPVIVIQSRPIVTANNQGINLAGTEGESSSGTREETA